MDPQGHDAEVLYGAQRLVSEGRIHAILFEVSPALVGAGSGLAGARRYADAVRWLRGYGYRCYACPDCYPRKGPLGPCAGKVAPLDGPGGTAAEAHAQATAAFTKLAGYSFRVNGVEHGWWTDVVCVLGVASADSH